MSQNVYANFIFSYSLNSHASFVLIFNGLNFSNWNEQVQIHLSVLDLNLTILEENPTTFTDASSNEEKIHYKVLEKSNKLSLMFMRMSVANRIKIVLPKINNDK